MCMLCVVLCILLHCKLCCASVCTKCMLHSCSMDEEEEAKAQPGARGGGRIFPFRRAARLCRASSRPLDNSLYRVHARTRGARKQLYGDCNEFNTLIGGSGAAWCLDALVNGISWCGVCGARLLRHPSLSHTHARVDPCSICEFSPVAAMIDITNSAHRILPAQVRVPQYMVDAFCLKREGVCTCTVLLNT
jgi:hypothetical protein